MGDFRRRLLGAARLDPATYEEVEHDPGALRQASGVVLLYGAAAGLTSVGPSALAAVFSGMIAAIVGWVIWAVLIFLIGTRLLPGRQTEANAGQLFRTLGFAAAPGIALVIGIISPLLPIVFVVTQVWMIAAMVVAVRQALDYTSTRRAVGVCVIAWLAQLLVAASLYAVLSPAATPPVAAARDSPAPAAASYVGVVKPSAVAPPVE